MNREEAIRRIWVHNRIHAMREPTAILITEALDMAIEALRGPQPDPITGLVPCGCGGKAEYYYHPIEDWVAVECVECGAGTSYKDTKEQARNAWNRAMGYKGEV